MRKAKKFGIKTWVSFEPVLYPEQTLKLLDVTYNFVDLFKVGKLNYHKKQSIIDWNKFYLNITEKLKKYNKDFYIKKDLKKYKP